MKKNEIVVGGLYNARISGNFVTVRVDAIRETFDHRDKSSTVFDVTNLKTGRKVTFRSAMKFRSKAAEPKAKEDVAYDRAAAATVRHDLRQTEGKPLVEVLSGETERPDNFLPDLPQS